MRAGVSSSSPAAGYVNSQQDHGVEWRERKWPNRYAIESRGGVVADELFPAHSECGGIISTPSVFLSTQHTVCVGVCDTEEAEAER